MVKQKRSTCDAILRQNMSMALWQKRDRLKILERLCHTRRPKHLNCCFFWHHGWKRETIYHLNIFIHLMKDAIKCFKCVFRLRKICKCFCKTSYIIWNVRLLSIHFTTFFVAKVIQQRKLVILYSQPSSSKEHSNHSFEKSRRMDAYTLFIAN